MKSYSNYNKNLKIYAREKRNHSTFGEILLWKNLLSKRKLGYQFNRQFPIQNFIVDFISRKLKLIIEVDGYSHQFKYDEDSKRDKILKELGFNVLRIQEKDIKYDFHNVVRVIEFYIDEFEEKNRIQSP